MMKVLLSGLLIIYSSAVFASEVKLCGVSWPPFTYVQNNQFVKGISHDIHREAFKRLGIKYKRSVFTWARCLAQVEKGVYDAVIDNSATAPFIYGKVPTAVYPLAVFVREDSADKHFSWEFMQGKKIGMVRGYDYTPKITGFKGWNVKYAKTDHQLLLKLKAKRTDYIILDIFSADILMKEAGIKVKMLTPLIDSTDLFLVFNKGRSALARQYDEVIQQMHSDGTLDKIYRQYLPFDYSQIIDMQGN